MTAVAEPTRTDAEASSTVRTVGMTSRLWCWTTVPGSDRLDWTAIFESCPCVLIVHSTSIGSRPRPNSSVWTARYATSAELPSWTQVTRVESASPSNPSSWFSGCT